MLIKSTIIPSNWISSPLNGKMAKENPANIPGRNKVNIDNEHTGQPAENKLIIPVKMPVPDSLLYFLISLNLNIIKVKFIPNKKDKIKVNKMFR